MSTMGSEGHVTIERYDVPTGTKVNCQTCGRLLDTKTCSLWNHYCFRLGHPKTHVFQLDHNYRLFIMPVSQLDTLDPATRELILSMSPCSNSSSTPSQRTPANAANPNSSQDFNESGFFEAEDQSHLSEPTMQHEESSNSELGFDIQLVALVRDTYTAIWDHIRIPVQDRTKVKILTMWVKIANHSGVSHEVAQKRWEELKKQYKDAKIKKDLRLVSSGSSTDPLQAVVAAQVDFPLFEEMKFLDDVLEPIRTSDSLPDSDASVQSTIDQYDRMTDKGKQGKGRKRSKGADELNGVSLLERECLTLLKENRDPEDERITAVIFTVKGAMKKIPERFWLRIQADLVNYFQSKIEEYNEES